MSNFYQQSMLTALGRKAGYVAFRCRQKRSAYEAYARQLGQWHRIFQLERVLMLGCAALAAIFMDFSLLAPVYRTMSEVIIEDANLLLIPIGLGINMVGVVCSDKLTQCFTTGAFHEWAQYQQSDGNADNAVLYALYNRRQRLHAFLISFFVYAGILLLVLWMRYSLLAGSSLPIKQIELPISLVGLLFSGVAVLCGVYLLPLFQYLSYSLRLVVLRSRMKGYIRQVAELDGDIHQLWFQADHSASYSQDVKESLIRFLFRTKSLDYCAPISEQEVRAFTGNFPPTAPPDLPGKNLPD